MHLAISYDTTLGGHPVHISRTLCGRESGESVEVNCEEDGGKVTCKLCQGIMADPSHWAHRRWLAPA